MSPFRRAGAEFAPRITALWAVLFALIVAVSLYYCDGRLIYTLDDPYISLKLANTILHGTYGVNVGEASNVSSSILWPWMLAITQALGLGAIGPLVLNAAAGAATVYVAARFLVRIGVVEANDRSSVASLLGLFVILVTSTLALPMIGMEHTWHVLTAIVVLDGLVAAASGQSLSPWCTVALVAMPLLRFEGTAFAAAAIVGFWYLGERRTAVVAAIAIGGLGALYTGYMLSLHLPVVPASVLLKSNATRAVFQGNGTHFGAAIFGQLAAAIHVDRARVLMVALAGLVAVCISQRKQPRRLAVYLPLVAAVGAHLIAGSYGWFGRYEVYVVALAAFGLLYALGSLPERLVWRAPHRGSVLAALILGAWFVAPYFETTFETPLAARNIYEQQYQMHRFVHDFYPVPVAVNDLGYVSFGNEDYVLDLYGLGSEEVRQMRMAHAYGPAQMAELVDKHHVALIMLYEAWFHGGTPSTWRKVAVLHSVHNIVASLDSVTFFVPPSTDARDVIAALKRFNDTLPDGTQIFLPAEDSITP
jgi:hypothetical protein